MRVLFGKRWRETWRPDSPRSYEDLRIEVLAARPLERTSPNPSVLRSLRDTLVRRTELDSEYVSCGIGRILEGPGRGELAPASTSPSFPPPALPAPSAWSSPARSSSPSTARSCLVWPWATCCSALRPASDEPKWWSVLRHHDPESDPALSPVAMQMVFKEAQRLMLETDWSRARPLRTAAEQTFLDLG